MSIGRLGVVTIIDNDNFGNRLQNFALQEHLRGRGWAVETILNSPAPMQRTLLAARAAAAVRSDGPLTFVRRNGPRLLERAREPRPDTRHSGPDLARRAAIQGFTDQHIQQLGTDYGELAEPAALADRYDRVIVGSDQVWNPGFRQANEIDFLTFVPPAQRLAYAASFGVHDIPTFLRRRYAQWLSQIPHISVREHRAAQIVRDLTGREVPVVADPTVLLDPARWHALAQQPDVLEGRRYLATFFLGGQSREETAAIADLARSEDLEVVDLTDPGVPGLAGLAPPGFVGAIQHAAVVATDSFHASVFALLFERDTVTKDRHADDTRLLTLFAHTGTPRVPWRTDTLRLARPQRWSDVHGSLADLRDASAQWLDGALGPPPLRVTAR